MYPTVFKNSSNLRGLSPNEHVLILHSKMTLLNGKIVICLTWFVACYLNHLFLLDSDRKLYPLPFILLIGFRLPNFKISLHISVSLTLILHIHIFVLLDVFVLFIFLLMKERNCLRKPPDVLFLVTQLIKKDCLL